MIYLTVCRTWKSWSYTLHFISNVSIPTLIYDGNHEATKKNKTFFTQLKKVTKDINPLVKVVDMSYYDNDFGFGVLPYADLHRKNSIELFDPKKPLFTHVRGEIPPHVKPEVDLDRFEDFPVVFPAIFTHTAILNATLYIQVAL